MKLFGKNTTIILDDQITKLSTTNEREKVLNDKEWYNYIVEYKKFNNNQDKNIIKLDRQPYNIKASDYPEVLLGGNI